MNVGNVTHAPDYCSHVPGGQQLPVRDRDYQSVLVYALTPDEVALLGKLRNLRPGQELRITRCAHGATWDTLLTDVAGDPD